MDGVRRASCRSVRDVQIPPHRTTHPSAPMDITPSSSRARTEPSWHVPPPSKDGPGPSNPAIVADASGSTSSFFRGDWLWGGHEVVGPTQMPGAPFPTQPTQFTQEEEDDDDDEQATPDEPLVRNRRATSRFTFPSDQIPRKRGRQ